MSYAQGASQAPLTIETVAGYETRRQWEDNQFVVSMAVTIAIGFLVTMLMLSLGFSAAYYYAAYLLLATHYLLSTTEYIFRWWFPDAIIYANELRISGSYAALAMLFLFQRAFLQAPTRYPRLNLLLLTTSALCFTNLIFHAYTDYQYFFQTLTSALAAIFVLLIPVGGIVAVKHKHRGGWPFLLSNGVISLSFLVLALSSVVSHYIRFFDVLAVNRFALIFEAAAFAFAMFSQVRGIREDREDALKAELQATHEKLTMAETLITTAHDLQQPLTSLRMTLKNSTEQPLPVEQIGSAVAYLDEIVNRQLKPAGVCNRDATIPTAVASQQHDHQATLTDDEAIEEFCVDIVLQNVVSMFRKEADDKCIDLRTVASSQLVCVSPLVLMRITSNLVSNAVKNTATGGVLIGCRIRGSMIRIDVCDTGPGVSEDKLIKILQPYQRAGEYAGTGLGLSIVRQLCDRHELKFNFTSTPGRGSVASVLVPRVKG